MSKAKLPSSPVLDLYDGLIAAHAGFERKGKANPFTSDNTYMSTYYGKDGHVAIRLGKAEREAFIAEHDTALAVSYGAVMKEFVVVPDALLEDRERMMEYLDLCLAFVNGLKPQARKKK